MENSPSNKPALLIGLLILAGAGVAVYLALRPTPPAPPTEPAAPIAVATPQAPPPVPEPVAIPAPAEATAAPVVVDAMEPANAQIREWAGMLSENPLWVSWTANQHLVAKFVAVVNLVASGESPRKLVPFFEPEGDFVPLVRGEKAYMDPLGYQRYDAVAQAFSSFDSHTAASLLKRLMPWFNAKYRQMGPPGKDFRWALTRAMSELLKVPVLEGDVELDRSKVMARLQNPDLEAMSDAQKHLFRMGPENIRKVQAKLRELARVLAWNEVESVRPLVPRPTP